MARHLVGNSIIISVVVDIVPDAKEGTRRPRLERGIV